MYSVWPNVRVDCSLVVKGYGSFLAFEEHSVALCQPTYPYSRISATACYHAAFQIELLESVILPEE